MHDIIMAAQVCDQNGIMICLCSRVFLGRTISKLSSVLYRSQLFHISHYF